MENYTHTTRFILSCNYSSKIIDPIQSRCAVFRFKLLPKQDMVTLMQNIAKTEHLRIDEKAIDALYEVSDGDCRRLENIMQSCSAMGEHITEELVFSMASVAKPKEILRMLSTAAGGDFLASRKMLLDVMLNYGLSGIDVIKQIQKEILELEMDDRKKMQLMSACGETEFRLTEGSDEYLQLEALLAQVCLAGK
jgi:replication factor C small subunit